MNSITNKVLVVEDEEQLLRMLQFTLSQSGYEITTAKTGCSAIDHLSKSKFNLVLLDLGLPDIDGKEIIEKTRTDNHTPIIVISARSSENEKITALDLGANDYIGKPFDTGELLARMRVALRPAPPSRHAAFGSDLALVLDFATRRAIVQGQAVRLSRKEAELLHLLSEANGAIVSHEAIIAAIWGRSSEADYMNLRVLAWQVRQKIEPDASVPRYLIAEAGEGYRLNLE